MATWTTLPDAALEPGKPIRSIDGLALRDNPVAITEGATGAPRIAAAALQTGNNERDWVLDRTASAAVGSIGTYALLLTTFTSTSTNVTTTYQFGTTHAGSSLRYTNTIDSVGQSQASTTAPAGTWRAMGQAFRLTTDNYGGPIYSPSGTVFLRIS
jgi:hypothetical protein